MASTIAITVGCIMFLIGVGFIVRSFFMLTWDATAYVFIGLVLALVGMAIGITAAVTGGT